MWFIWTLDSHELLGPFTTQNRAHLYALKNSRTSYQLQRDAICQQRHIHQTLTLVPCEDR
jgi:hypothetical protein